MDIIFLGTNGWYDTETGNTVCTLIRSREYTIILDAGNGFYKVDSYIAGDGKRVGYLLLSHFHLDHIIGLHMLHKTISFSKLVIAGPTGVKEHLNRLVSSPYTMPFEKLSYQVELLELPEYGHQIPFPLETAPLLHGDVTLGYRLQLEGKSIAYCPDTGYCENAVKLAQNVDLLITECAYRSGEENPRWPHLNPEDAARIASEAKAKQLVLTHFDASRYGSLQERSDAEVMSQRIYPASVSARDGVVISL